MVQYKHTWHVELSKLLAYTLNPVIAIPMLCILIVPTQYFRRHELFQFVDGFKFFFYHGDFK